MHTSSIYAISTHTRTYTRAHTHTHLSCGGTPVLHELCSFAALTQHFLYVFRTVHITRHALLDLCHRALAELVCVAYVNECRAPRLIHLHRFLKLVLGVVLYCRPDVFDGCVQRCTQTLLACSLHSLGFLEIYRLHVCSRSTQHTRHTQ